MILERSKTYKGLQFDIWSPEQAIINIFANEHYEDPDGLLTLSVRQMQRLKEWARPKDHISSGDYVNGMPDVAT